MLATAVVAGTLLSFANLGKAADKITIGTLKLGGSTPAFLAVDRGYFATEGLDATVHLVDLPQLLSQGLVSGDFDFSFIALSAATFNLAGQGALRIIGGASQEAPGFQGSAMIVSNAAFGAGLKAMGDLAGHSYALPALGTIPQFQLGVIADKYGFSYASLKTMQLGSISNVMSSIVGGTADSTIVAGPYAKPLIAKKQVQSLGWFGDQARMQLVVLFTSGLTADKRPEIVKHFLNAYRAGVNDYRDAFIDAGEHYAEGPNAPEMFATIAKWLGVPLDIAKLGAAYLPRDGAVDVRDVMHQAEWYKSQGMVKPEIDTRKIIDTRYVIPMAD